MIKNLEFDKVKGVFIKREEISIGNTKDSEDIKEALRIELAGIVRQVKSLKKRAEEIKTMMAALDRKTEPIGSVSVPVVEESQSSPAGSTDPRSPLPQEVQQPNEQEA